jgi:hypothetical protein
MIERNNKQESVIDLMNDKFGEDFVRRIEETLKLVASLKYDVAESRMHMEQFTRKNETESIEKRLEKMTPMKNHIQLVKRCDEFAMAEKQDGL